MRIDTVVKPFKSIRGKVLGYIAGYRDVQTGGTYPTKEHAASELTKLIEFRCSAESATVKVLTIRSHVGIFSYGLLTGTETRHVAPGDSGPCRGVTCGYESLEEAENSFRYNVAQLTWNGTLDGCDILPDRLHKEFRSWCEWQLRYRIAKKQGMTDTESHAWACDTRNPYLEETDEAPEPTLSVFA